MNTDMPYQPFYCEENVWKFLSEPRFEGIPCGALFISNDHRSVAMAGQKGAVKGWVIWDYHVVLLQGDEKIIWDPNALAPSPQPANDYLDGSFPHHVHLPSELQPRFRLVPRIELLETFASDRRHMRRPDGAWPAPPPSWPSPGVGHTLPRFVDMVETTPGACMNIDELRRHPWCCRN